MDIKITKRQQAFINASAPEVLFGGAAGGGKSYGQVVDALLFALKYPKSRQLILRRTYTELEKSLIRTAQELYPRDIFQYNSSKHYGKFPNGSIIDFGYCDKEDDVFKYQSAEYDIIRFDELTHFTEFMYKYLTTRIRGVNNYPKQVKSSTNPGGVGHNWVKERFIDIGPPNIQHGRRIFLPSFLQDNKFLMESDPGYVDRLKEQDEKHQKALLYGDWDIFDGQYFTEFKRDLHVVEPFEIPKHWRRYFTLDYGLDMLAGYWIAVDTENYAYVYREIYKPNLIISDAAKAIKALDDEDVFAYLAPGDLWNRRQDTGKSAAEIFFEHGVPITKASNNRVQGWLNLKEWLKPIPDMFGKLTPHLRIFNNCVNLIRCLPGVQIDAKNPSDVATEPHELTHAPDAIRYFVAGRPIRAEKPVEDDADVVSFEVEVDDFISFGV